MTPRVASCLAGLVLASGAMACGSLLGIDPGEPRDGGGADIGSPDVAVESGDETGVEVDASGDGGADADADTGPCITQGTFCNAHCGQTLDNCGRPIECGPTCNVPPKTVCGGPSGHDCVCTQLSGLCNNKCGVIVDNCGAQLDCGNCTNGATCSQGSCGCVPESAVDACARENKQCGYATDAVCGQLVPCGTSTGDCVTGVCQSDSTCCSPLTQAMACGKQTCGFAYAGCDVTVGCGVGGSSSCADEKDTCSPDGVCCVPLFCGGVQCGTFDSCTGTTCNANGPFSGGSTCKSPSDCCLVGSVHGDCVQGQCSAPPSTGDGGVGDAGAGDTGVGDSSVSTGDSGTNRDAMGDTCSLGGPGAACLSPGDCCSGSCNFIATPDGAAGGMCF